jgi:hypothetical protein
MKIRFTCSLPYTSFKVSSSTSAVCSFSTASASRFSIFFSAGVGDDFPVDGEGEVLPDDEAGFSLVFSIAFAAVTFEPSSSEGASFDVGESDLLGAAAGADGTPVDNTFGLGCVASVPSVRTFAFGAAAGVVLEDVIDAADSAGAGTNCWEVSPVGLFAILMGACLCCCCGWKLPGPWL